MKNIIKKIASVAMAFTLLGAGTAITKTIAPQKANANTIVAHAGSTTCYGHSQFWTDFFGQPAYKEFYYGSFTGRIYLPNTNSWVYV